MADDTDPVLAAVAALRARGIAAIPVGDDFERWRIGDFTYGDADLLRLAGRFGGLDGATEPSTAADPACG